MSSVANDELNDTRQLLDELDALMDQMLALPVGETEQGQAPISESTSIQPAPVMLATLTLVDANRDFLAETINHAKANSEAPPARLSVIAAPPLVELEKLPPQTLPAHPQPGTIAYQFLLWVNQGFDRGASRFGPIGKLLRSRFGRMMLGFTGLSLLSVAVAWLCKDWLGWND